MRCTYSCVHISWTLCCLPKDTSEREDRDSNAKNVEHLDYVIVHLIYESTLLSLSSLCVLMRLCLSPNVDHHANNEGSVSKNAASHTEVAETDIFELFVLKRNYASEVVYNWVCVRKHYHACAQLNVVRMNVFSCCISH